MKRNKLLSLLLALIMIIGMFSGCGSEKTGPAAEDSSKEDSSQSVTDTPSAVIMETTTESSYDSFPASLKAELIGSIELDRVNTDSCVALTYTDDSGKYGIMSLDGTFDTGAKYTLCREFDDYFQVSTSDFTTYTNVDSLNCIGIVDASGNEIVPMEYASIDKINDRYLRLCVATEQTENQDEALLYYTDELFSITASEDDTFFKGRWYVYDLFAGKMLDGVSATNAYSIYDYGDIIEYVTDEEEQIAINHKGEQLPEDADLFENGCYSLEDGTTGVMYDSEFNKMFEYDLEGFVPTICEDEYFIACKYLDDSRTYVLMDTTGKIVSGEFSDLPFVYGDLIHSGEQVYNMAGEIIIEGTFNRVYQDELFAQAWFLENDDNYTLITKDGTVLYQGMDDDLTNIDPYYTFSAVKTVDDKKMYYCIADQDFTLEGYSAAPWLVRVSMPDYFYDLADFISGNTIISGYDGYSYVCIPGSAIYVYAEKADGGLDIYTVK